MPMKAPTSRGIVEDIFSKDKQFTLFINTGGGGKDARKYVREKIGPCIS